MKLNKAEFMVMNNPIRALVQDKHEVKILREMSSSTAITNALEIGCGNGNGTKLIMKYFAPKHITAIDLDEKMIALARKNNKNPSVEFRMMDATRLAFPDNHFDAIFDFGIIHHIPDWENCINELWRVLKRNGELILEELSIESFSTGIGKLWRTIFDHPYEAMYSKERFIRSLEERRFTITNYAESTALLMFKLFSLTAIKGEE